MEREGRVGENLGEKRRTWERHNRLPRNPIAVGLSMGRGQAWAWVGKACRELSNLGSKLKPRPMWAQALFQTKSSFQKLENLQKKF